MFLHYTVCEAGSHWHTGDTVESSGRSDLFGITEVYEIWAGISNYFDFEGPFLTAVKKQLGVQTAWTSHNPGEEDRHL